MTAGAAFYRVAQDYTALIDVIRERTEQMEIGRLELDLHAHLAEGHSGKLLGPNSRKTLGLRSLGNMLQTLGLIMVIVENPVQRDFTLAKRQPFDSTNRRPNNKCNPCKTVPRIESPTAAKIEAPEPAPRPQQISHSHLRVIQERPKRSAVGRA